MTKTSFIAGLGLSLIAHGLLLLPGFRAWGHPIPIPEPETNSVAKLTLPPPPIPEPLPKEPLKPDEVKPREEPKKEESKEVRELEDVAKLPETLPLEEAGDFSDDGDEDAIPELRLVWDSPEQLVQVSKVLGMRILMVDRRHQPVSELILEKDLLVKEFRGNLTNFSNRVRTLSAQFFGPVVARQSAKPIECFWVMVPASVDQEWISVQKQAIRSRGLKNSQVSYVEARIQPNGGSCTLAVTRIVTL